MSGRALPGVLAKRARRDAIRERTLRAEGHGEERPRTMAQMAEDASGVMYVEFLIVILPLFVFFLGIIQLGLAYSADLIAAQALTTAARATAVVLDDDPLRYGGADRGVVSGGGPASPSMIDRLGEVIGGSFTSAGGALNSGNQRMRAIRDAASIPLIATAPSFQQLVGDANVRRALGGGSGGRALSGMTLYHRYALAVLFPTGNRLNADEDVSGDMQKNAVPIRLRYLFHCGVPLVSRFMCGDIFEHRFGGVPQEMQGMLDRARRTVSGAPFSGVDPGTILITGEVPAGVMGRARDADATLAEVTNEIRRASVGRVGSYDLDMAEDPNLGLVMAAFGNPRYLLITRQTTVRVHVAPYSYRFEIPPTERSGNGPITTIIQSIPIPSVEMLRERLRQRGVIFGAAAAGRPDGQPHIVERSPNPYCTVAAAKARAQQLVETQLAGQGLTVKRMEWQGNTLVIEAERGAAFVKATAKIYVTVTDDQVTMEFWLNALARTQSGGIRQQIQQAMRDEMAEAARGGMTPERCAAQRAGQ